MAMSQVEGRSFQLHMCLISKEKHPTLIFLFFKKKQNKTKLLDLVFVQPVESVKCLPEKLSPITALVAGRNTDLHSTS